jgi:hypothetical protein
MSGFDRKGGLEVAPGEGNRIIVWQVGSPNTGFIPESKLVYLSCPQGFLLPFGNECRMFQRLVSEQVREGSIILMHNASHHSVAKGILPNISTRRDKTSQTGYESKRVI